MSYAKTRTRLQFLIGGLLAAVFVVLSLTAAPGPATRWMLRAYAVVLLGAAYVSGMLRQARIRSEIQEVEGRIRLAGLADDADYFDLLVTINVDNLRDYYTLVKNHTQQSFVVSVAAGSIGFLLIVTGLVASYGSSEASERASVIASGSGVLIEFIAGIFFYLYKRTVRQLKEYHDSLIDVQNVLLSFKILGDLEPGERKAEVTGEMIKFLLGRGTP